jgi:hypothetical protein
MDNTRQEQREKWADQMGQFLAEMLGLALAIAAGAYFWQSSRIEIDLNIGKAMACEAQPCSIDPYRSPPTGTP